MDNMKIEDIEHSSNADHIYAGKEDCLLEESDTQCGYVFFNEFTRLLKFHCTYCRETYDNIEYFCQHLSNHINEYNDEVFDEIKAQSFKGEKVELEPVVEIEDSENENMHVKACNELEVVMGFLPQKDKEAQQIVFECEQLQEVSSKNGNDMERSLDSLSNEEMLIEEIEDSEERKAEIEEEINQQMEKDGTNLFLLEAKSSNQINYDENNHCVDTNTITPTDNLKNDNSFVKCFIKESNIDKIRSEGVCVLKEKNHKSQKPMQRKRPNIQDLLRLKRRRKKVTTVKVIAVKNRIAELYERIQNEQQKSQQFFSNDILNVQQEQETQKANQGLIKDEVKTDNKQITIDDKTIHATSDVSRKIIGETLITLIPEGTKIPNKMPALIKIPMIKNEQSPGAPNYDKCEIDDKVKKIAVCPACGKSFRSHFSLTIHKRIHYLESDSSVKLAHKCSDCDQLFNKLSQLKHHVETVHYAEGFVCKICNRQLSSLSLLERHMVKVHLDRPFNCKKCNKNFSDPFTFEEHLASHNSGEVFKCTTCGRKYATEYFLLEHMRNHKEQVPQTCVVCGKVTLRITQHMKIHTPRPKRLLSCSECGKVFNFSSGLSHHFKVMHKLPRPPPKSKKDTHTNTFKRKRRSRTNERNMNKKKHLINSASIDSNFIMGNETFHDHIIEEQIEIPEVNHSNPTHTEIQNLKKTEKKHIEEQANLKSTSQVYITNPCAKVQAIIKNFHQDNVINHKEEEAKRVIVELIQNSTYTSYFSSDSFSSVLEVTPPIAREETISAVNSIVHDC